MRKLLWGQLFGAYKCQTVGKACILSIMVLVTAYLRVVSGTEASIPHRCGVHCGEVSYRLHIHMVYMYVYIYMWVFIYLFMYLYIYICVPA